MSTSIKRATWRRSLAATAALTLPFGLAACSDDANEDPDVINENQVDQEGDDQLEDTEPQQDEDEGGDDGAGDGEED